MGLGLWTKPNPEFNGFSCGDGLFDPMADEPPQCETFSTISVSNSNVSFGQVHLWSQQHLHLWIITKLKHWTFLSTKDHPSSNCLAGDASVIYFMDKVDTKYVLYLHFWLLLLMSSLTEAMPHYSTDAGWTGAESEEWWCLSLRARKPEIQNEPPTVEMSASLDGGIYETVTLPLFIRLRMNSYTMVIILLLSPLSLLCTVTLGERCLASLRLVLNMLLMLFWPILCWKRNVRSQWSWNELNDNWLDLFSSSFQHYKFPD